MKSIESITAPFRDPNALHSMQTRGDGTQYCTICNGSGTSLTIDCPKSQMTQPRVQAVRAGRLDYMVGLGWFANHPSAMHLADKEI